MGIKFSSFYTDRAHVKPWLDTFEKDEGDVLTALLTPEFLKSLPEPLQVANTPENCQAWMAARLAESDVLAILTSNTGRLIGVIILAEIKSKDAMPDIHLGYLLAQQYWGQGFATEVILGLVAHLALEKHPMRLLGGVEKSNATSARVLQKAGFELQPSLSDENTEMFARIV